MRLNCIDVDNTLTVGVNDTTNLAMNCIESFEDLTALRELFALYPSRFVEDVINDDDKSTFGKAVRKSIIRGDKVALTTMNASRKYCIFVLAMLGLNYDEIRTVYLRTRKEGDSVNSKIEHIKDAHSYFFGNDDILNSNVKITLIDDNYQICIDALKYGNIGVIHADGSCTFFGNYIHLLKLPNFNSQNDESEIRLTPICSRMDVFEYSLSKLEQPEITISNGYVHPLEGVLLCDILRATKHLPINSSPLFEVYTTPLIDQPIDRNAEINLGDFINIDLNNRVIGEESKSCVSQYSKGL